MKLICSVGQYFKSEDHVLENWVPDTLPSIFRSPGTQIYSFLTIEVEVIGDLF